MPEVPARQPPAGPPSGTRDRPSGTAQPAGRGVAGPRPRDRDKTGARRGRRPGLAAAPRRLTHSYAPGQTIGKRSLWHLFRPCFVPVSQARGHAHSRPKQTPCRPAFYQNFSRVFSGGGSPDQHFFRVFSAFYPAPGLQAGSRPLRPTVTPRTPAQRFRSGLRTSAAGGESFTQCCRRRVLYLRVSVLTILRLFALLYSQVCCPGWATGSTHPRRSRSGRPCGQRVFKTSSGVGKQPRPTFRPTLFPMRRFVGNGQRDLKVTVAQAKPGQSWDKAQAARSNHA